MPSTPTFRALSSRISPSTKLKTRPPVGNPAAFSWRFGKLHAYSYSGGFYLENDTHPLHELSKRLWNAKKEPLWLSVVAAKHYKEKNSRCVRSWLARRLRVSFFESLRKSGYAPDGTPLGATQGDKALYGTAQLFADRQMLKISPKGLEEQTDRVVDEIIRLQSESTHGTKKCSNNNGGSREGKERSLG